MLKYLPVISFLIGMITSAAIAYAIVQFEIKRHNAEHIENYHSSVENISV